MVFSPCHMRRESLSWKCYSIISLYQRLAALTALYSLMFPDNRPALYAAVRWLTASRIDLSTHGFLLENVLIVTVSVACSVSEQATEEQATVE